MLTIIRAFLPSWMPIWLVGAISIAVASGGVSGWAVYRLQQAKYDRLVASYAISELRATREASDVAYKVGFDAAAKIQKTVTITKTQLREVPKYVTIEADRKCVLTRGFVGLHDAAAHGIPLPQSTPGDNDTASDIALSEASGTIVSNYGICREDQQRLRSAQDYINELRAKWPH